MRDGGCGSSLPIEASEHRRVGQPGFVQELNGYRPSEPLVIGAPYRRHSTAAELRPQSIAAVQ
jgi:hypothetical protein